MGERDHHNHQQLHQQPQRRPTRRGSGGGGGGGGGEIVEVEGGHIVRSTGRKDRHSKVCTAKGPRDRRVRLSAHTAIQFYDVQDRLGYDRPSKAVDWLIKKAKPAIDELAVLPPWHPNDLKNADPDDRNDEQGKRPADSGEPGLSSSGFLGNSGRGGGDGDGDGGGGSTSFLPPSLDSDAIADTIKSFFPMASSSQSPNFQSFSSSPSVAAVGDLRLSLQSFQEPILLHQHQQQQSTPSSSTEQGLFFEAASSGWTERLVAWNPADAGVFNAPPPPQMMLQPLLGQSPSFFQQRGPLQSSNSPAIATSIQSWEPTASIAEHNHHLHHHHHQLQSPSAIGFASSGGTGGGFPGFRVPARIQGEEEHDASAGANKPWSCR